MNFQSWPQAHADELLRVINEACYTNAERDSVMALQEIWDNFAYAEGQVEQERMAERL